MLGRIELQEIVDAGTNITSNNLIEKIDKIEGALERVKPTERVLAILPCECNFSLPNEYLAPKIDSEVTEEFLGKSEFRRDFNYFKYNQKIDEIIEILDLIDLDEISNETECEEDEEKMIEEIEKIFM